jgi:Asp-tRNA(Asn)/Glu-tRNA(Gln) amidotransferase A subunit family amidase
MQHPREMTIQAAGRKLRDNDLTARQLVASCLERIHVRDNTIHAWGEVYAEAALAEARRCDEELQGST